MREILGATVWDMQARIIESVRDNKRTAVRSCHGIGKSFLASHVALWFLNAHPNSIVATTAPTFRQVEKILWQEIGKAVALAPAPLGGKVLNTEIKIAPGWYAFGFSSDDPTSAQGIHAEHVLIIYDEASGLTDELCEALEGALTSGHCRLLSIGNPTSPTSWFAREFKTPGTERFAVSALDTPNFTEFGITLEDLTSGEWERKVNGAKMPAPWLITPEWTADKVKRWGVESPAFKSRVLAEFPDAGDDTLIPLSWIEAAQQRTIELDAKVKHPDELAVDVARFGGDETVIGRRRGVIERGSIYRVHGAHRGFDTMQTAGAVARAMVETGATVAKIDANGVGGGVFDRLKEQGKWKVAALNAGEAAHDPERFVNARAEWFWNLRGLFEQGLVDIDPNDDDLLGQLSALKFKVDSRGRILIESKQDMRKRGMPSPDRADTMAMAYATSSKSASAFVDAMRRVRA
jgi:hypothetical protein